MATKISSDISTNVDITARKNDSFFLQVTIKNSDDSSFDLTNSISDFVIENNNKTQVKLFTSRSGTTDEVQKFGTISSTEGDFTPTDGVLTISVVAIDNIDSVTYNNMNIPSGTYSYYLKITGTDDVYDGLFDTNTILHGKFKVVD